MLSQTSDSLPQQEKVAVMKKRVAIIGSGVSGILAIKACKEEEDIFSEIICFEKTSDAGGLWKYREFNDNNGNNNNDKNDKNCEIVTVMKGTIANSSKEMSAFSDFPPTEDTPNFMHHKLMLRYIESYAETFDCLKHIQFGQEVLQVSRSNAKWKILLRDHSQRERSEFFDAVFICTGHHGRPYIPSFPGLNKFQGKRVKRRRHKLQN